MKKSIALFALLGVFSSVAVLAAPPANPKSGKKPAPTKKVAKVTDVWHCPMTGEAVADHKNPEKGTLVGDYRVHFCCPGCPEAFAKLSKKDQIAKTKEMAKKDTDAKSSGSKKS